MPTARPNWIRLEPQPREPSSIASGLRAEVADPLWLLARQRQMRALRGENAGSPVRVRLEGEATRLTRYKPGTPDGSPGAQWAGREPLEARVEAEPERLHPLRLAATAGLHFLALLEQQGVGDYAAAYREHYPLAGATAASPAAKRFLLVLAGRAPDGVALQADLMQRPGDLPPKPTVQPADRPAVLEAARRFRAWYAALAQPAGSPTWEPERLEYAFAVAAPRAGGEVVLTASEYDQGRLDWNAFDLAPDGTVLGAAGDTGVTAPFKRDGVPTPVAYRGMPVQRFWQFEDAGVDFGDLNAAREDLTRLLLVEFALVYGNDHFVVPLDIDVGSLANVDRLVVTDTFGTDVEVPHVAEADARDGRPGTFRLFELAADSVRSPLFFLPPSLGASLHGRPIEEVRLLRDEGANLAWAVETTAARDDGFPVDRASAWRGGPPAPSMPATGEPTWNYRLRTVVPDHWRPLVPIQDRPGVIHLESGSLPALDGAPTPPVWGHILAELSNREIPEEEIGRAASSVTRAWQYARWIDGRQHAWIGRRRGPVAFTGDSGLRFDDVQASGTTSQE